jgi:hypothetical protein
VATVLKGINKRVIIIKNLNSEIIEEAYFILKSGRGFKSAKENEMVAEANRIISEYHSQQRQLADNGGSARETNAELEKFLQSKSEDKSEKAKRKEIEEKEEKSITAAANSTDLPDGEIFEDAKLFEHIQGVPLPKNYFHNLNFNSSGIAGNNFKSAFNLASARKIKTRRFRMPSKGFFVGIGVMSGIVVAIKLIEYIIWSFK